MPARACPTHYTMPAGPALGFGRETAAETFQKGRIPHDYSGDHRLASRVEALWRYDIRRPSELRSARQDVLRTQPARGLLHPRRARCQERLPPSWCAVSSKPLFECEAGPMSTTETAKTPVWAFSIPTNHSRKRSPRRFNSALANSILCSTSRLFTSVGFAF